MKLTITLLLALVISNSLWAYTCRTLWYRAAEAEGHLDEAEHYIQTTAGCGYMSELPYNTVDCDPVMVNGREKQGCHVE